MAHASRLSFGAVIRGDLNPQIGHIGTLTLAPAESNPRPPGAWLPNPAVAETWIQFMRGTLPEDRIALVIPVAPPPRLASVSPGSHDFGKIATGATIEPALFQVAPLADGPVWDTLRASSIESRCTVEVRKTPGGWRVAVRPAPERLPIGRISETVALRFSQDGQPILGGANVSLSFVHESDQIQLSSYFFYLGVHAGERQMSLTLTAPGGKPLEVTQAKLLTGTAAAISFARESPSSGRLTARFLPLPEEGSHSGTFSVLLEHPVKAELLIPFIGAYKNQTTPPESAIPSAASP